MTATNGQLQSFIDRLERLQTEKDAIAEDIKEVMAEAKSSGFDPKIIRQVLKLRKMDAAERQEQEALLAAYEAALGSLASTPLGEAAISRATVRKVDAVSPVDLPTKPEPDDDDGPGEPTPSPLEAKERDGWADIEAETAKAIGRAISDVGPHDGGKLIDPPANLPDKVASAVERLRRGMDAGAGAT